jgi:hypothetical protein
VGLLDEKGWIAQDFYNEYLDLKVEISEMVKNIHYIQSRGLDSSEFLETRKEKLNEKVKRMRFILEQFKLNGVALEDLILLSLGVDV